MQRELNSNDEPPPALAVPSAVSTLELALRHAPSAGVILALETGALKVANALARRLLQIREGQPGEPLSCAHQADLVRASRDSLASGRSAWFGVEGDVIEVRAAHAGDALVAWLGSSRTSLAARLRPHLEDALHGAGIGFWEYDLDDDQMLWDAQCFTLFGRDPAQGPPNRSELMAHVHPEDHEGVDRAFRDAGGHTGAHGIVFRVVLPNGRTRHIDSRAELVRRPGMRARRLVGLVFDVTGSREADAAHRRLSERLAALSGAAGVGVWSLDFGRGRVEWNAQMYPMFGRAPLEPPLPFSECMQRVDEADRDGLHQDLVRVIEHGGVLDREVRVLGDDGVLRWLYVRGRRERCSPDSPLVGICLDVTPARAAIARSAELAERLRLAKDAAHLGMWKMDVESGHLDWDPQTYALHGAEPGDSRSPLEIFHASVHAEDRARIDAEMLRAASGQGMLDTRYRVVFADGAVHHVATRADRSETAPPRQLIGVSWEITASVEAGIALRTRETAERANRAKSEFVARMSHALRTPLNAVLGFTQLLERDDIDPLSDGQRDRVERIRTAGFHLLNLVSDVLDLSRIETGAMSVAVEVVELAPLITDTLADIAPAAAGRDIALESEVGADAPRRLWADRARLRQVLATLVTNAVKYNRRGGRVGVIARRASADVAQIVVRDTGVGMSEAQVQSLFTPFNRGGHAAGEAEGSGLGLAVAARLVEQMHGTLHVTSTPGVGSEFCIALREVPGGTDWGQTGTAPAMPLPVREDVRGSVLYIEDNPANSLFVEQLLHSRPNVRLYKAPDGTTGLVLAAASRPDLILIDFRLPDMHGLEVLRRLRAQAGTAHTPCVAISAHALPAEIEQARAGGFHHYWIKPLDAAEFLAGIDALLGTRADGELA